MRFTVLILLISYTFPYWVKEPINANAILIGKWRYSARLGNNGAKDYEYIIPDTTNKYLIFFKNGEVKGNYVANGTYRIKNDMIIIRTIKNKILKYQFNLTGNYLYLNPYPLLCDEGCADKFTKVNP